MIRRALACACLAVVAGCAATLDTATTTTDRLTLDTGAEATYRQLVTAMRRCYTVPSIKVEADYFPEAKAGDVRLIWGNDVGVIEWMRIQVRQEGAGSTITAVRRTAQDKFPAALEAWSRGDSSLCPYA